MGETTAIAWTDHTFNPWWGCTRVSPGCQHCYAETFAKRTGHAVWGQHAPRRVIGEHTWNDPIRWNRAAEAAGRPALVFAASMADVFEDVPDDVPMVDSHGNVVEGRTVAGERARFFELVEATPWLRWQVLTKRPENVLRMVPERWLEPGGWPPNWWQGTTVEDQPRALDRMPHLLAIPAPVRFLSCEPLVGEVRLARWLFKGPDRTNAIQWVIVGGESGPKHRPLDLRHARILLRECTTGGVPFFFKQVGGQTPKAGGDQLDGRTYKAFPGDPPPLPDVIEDEYGDHYWCTGHVTPIRFARAIVRHLRVHVDDDTAREVLEAVGGRRGLVDSVRHIALRYDRLPHDDEHMAPCSWDAPDAEFFTELAL